MTSYIHLARTLWISLAFVLVGCNAFIEESKRTKADSLIAEAEEKLAANDVKGNLRILNEAASVDPTHPRVWGRLCEGYQLTEEFEKAIAACKRNIDLRGDGLDYNSLGLAHMAKRDYPNAALAFEQAVKKSPQGISYGNYVWSLESAQQYEKAMAAAERWVELSEHDSSEIGRALENLAAIYVKLGQTGKARETLARIHAIEPQSNFQVCELKTDDKGDVSVTCSSSSQRR